MLIDGAPIISSYLHFPLPAAAIRTLLLSGRARKSPDKRQAALHRNSELHVPISPRRASTLDDVQAGSMHVRTFSTPQSRRRNMWNVAAALHCYVRYPTSTGACGAHATAVIHGIARTGGRRDNHRSPLPLAPCSLRLQVRA